MFLTGLGVAVPPRRFTQKECRKALRERYEPSFCLRLLKVLGKNSEHVFVYYNPAGPGFNMSPSDFTFDTFQTGEASSETFRLREKK